MTSATKVKPLITEGIETEAEMLAEFGHRCPDFVAGCACCDGWLEWDLRNTKLEDV